MRKFKNNNYLAIEKGEWCEIKDGVYGCIKIPKELIENSKDWVEIFEPKINNGDVVKNKYGAMYLITDYEKGHGFGFNSSGDWIISQSFSLDSSVNELKLATKEEWLEALTKDAVKRGLKEGVKYLSPKMKHERTISYPFYLSRNGDLADSNNAIIMIDGIWADPIKEGTLEELACRFVNYGYTRKDFITFFNENKETIHRLSK